MPGLLDTQAAPDLPDERRLALVVATESYEDAALHRLRAPAHDAIELGEVLANPEVGGFAVTSVIDSTAQEVRLAVGDFLADRGPDDLVLVYLSCHGQRAGWRPRVSKHNGFWSNWKTAVRDDRSSCLTAASAARSPSAPRAPRTSGSGSASTVRGAAVSF